MDADIHRAVGDTVVVFRPGVYEAMRKVIEAAEAWALGTTDRLLDDTESHLARALNDLQAAKEERPISGKEYIDKAEPLSDETVRELQAAKEER
jgi:hypothetical protein